MLVQSELDSEEGPHESSDYLAVLMSDFNNWAAGTKLDMHRKYNLHIIPDEETTGKPFDVETCENLGINVHQWRDVHGKWGS